MAARVLPTSRVGGASIENGYCQTRLGCRLSGGGTALRRAIECRGRVDAPASCRSGTCAVKVVSDQPDHRDTALTDVERTQAGLMCICVSRATSAELTLDL